MEALTDKLWVSVDLLGQLSFANGVNAMKETRSTKHHQPSLMRYIMLLVMTLLCTLGFYGLRLYSQAKYTAETMYTPTTAGKQAAAKIKARKPISILLLGADTGAVGRTYQGNSDTMIICTIDPQHSQTKLLSIPRDTNAEIVGTENFRMFKINDAYTRGGSTMARATAEKLLNVPLNYFVTIDMGGLQTIVDALGGVDVLVPFSFTSSHTGNQHFTKGMMHLDGEHALAYARMRYEDPKGDYGRQQRQQQIIKAVVKKAISTKGLTQFSAILKTLSKNVKTDLSFDDMVAIFQNYRGAAKHISTTSLQGYEGLVQTTASADPLSFQIPATKTLQAASNELRTTLGLSKAKLTNATTKENTLNPDFIFGPVQGKQYFVNYVLN